MATRDPAQTRTSAEALRVAGRARRRPDDPLLLERLAETGFLATEFGLDHQAELIFRCLVRLRPGKPSPRIALAMVDARRGRLESAIGQMRQILEEHPGSDLARAVLGTMLLHTGAVGARELLEDIIAHGNDLGAVSVAASCIEQIEAQQARSSASEQSALEFHRHHNIRA